MALQQKLYSRAPIQAKKSLLPATKSIAWSAGRSDISFPLLHATSSSSSCVWRDASAGLIGLASSRCAHAPFPRLRSLNRAILHVHAIVLIRENGPSEKRRGEKRGGGPSHCEVGDDVTHTQHLGSSGRRRFYLSVPGSESGRGCSCRDSVYGMRLSRRGAATSVTNSALALHSGFP